MAIDKALIDVYSNAEYVVYAEPVFNMYVDTYSDLLKRLLFDNQCTQAAFITAYNPYSENLGEQKNIKRQTTLIEELCEMGFSFLHGLGRDKEGLWLGEKSVLVFNISNETARMLGNKYGQNAILWIEEDAIPQLLLLDGKKNIDHYLPIITHIPHSSPDIPIEDQANFLRSSGELKLEVNKLNDHYTDRLFQSNLSNVTPLIFPINRFLVDVERFELDEQEPMSAKGMGALYTHDTEGVRFRESLTGEAREALLNKYYRPHHKQLNLLVEKAINGFGQALIVDGHSFPDIPLPCDSNQEFPRPDICLGTDSFHTPEWIIELAKAQFEKQGYSVEINSPYNGTMVPLDFYKTDNRVSSIMIEINRRLYLDDEYQAIQPNFEKLNACINQLFALVTEQFKHHETKPQ
jgi:N-formylglutamate amidohydrolase